VVFFFLFLAGQFFALLKFYFKVSFTGQNPAIKNFTVTLLTILLNHEACTAISHLKGHSQQDKRITDKQWSLGYLWTSPAHVKLSDGRCQLQQQLGSEISGSYSSDGSTSTALTLQQNRGSVGYTARIGKRGSKQPE